MRRLAATLALLLSAPALAQDISGREHHEPTAVQDSLRGPVRSVRYASPDAGSGEVALVTTYDRMGRRGEMLEYRGDDLRSRLAYTYDERGRNTGWEFYEVPRHGAPHAPVYESPPGTPLPDVPERHVIVLDDAGRRTETRDIRANGTLRSRVTFALDSAGRVRVMEVFDHAGQSVVRHEIGYDSAGRLLLPGCGVARYDSIGRKRQVDVYEGDQVRWRTVYRYDGEGRLTEEETRDLIPTRVPERDDPGPQKVVYTYQPDGSRTVETIRMDRDGAPAGRVVERFDAAGRRAEREEFRPDGTRATRLVPDPVTGKNVEVAGLARWTEELDAHGNWTRRAHIIIPDDGSPPILLWEQVREIAYW